MIEQEEKLTLEIPEKLECLLEKVLLKHLQIFSSSYCREPHISISSDRIDYLNILLAQIGLKELEGVRV